MKNDKVNGLFLTPFPWVQSSSDLYEHHQNRVNKPKAWYLVEIDETEVISGGGKNG